METQIEKMTEKWAKEFNRSYNGNKSCQSCYLMREEYVEKEIMYEVIDKKENKRLARRGKAVSSSRSRSSNSNEDGEESDEEDQGKKRT
jgi:Zn-finger protein